MSETERPSLIRLTLYKPMGIVFEPIPKNNSSSKSVSRSGKVLDDDTGARIKHLSPRGAAAKTSKLRVGDELISIDDEFTSQLPFDDIMSIFVNAKRSFSLLFRARKESPLMSIIVVPSLSRVENENRQGLSNQNPKLKRQKSKILKESKYDQNLAVALRNKVVANAKKQEKGRRSRSFIQEEKSREPMDENAPPPIDRGIIEMFFDTLCAPCGLKEAANAYQAGQMERKDGYLYTRGK